MGRLCSQPVLPKRSIPHRRSYATPLGNTQVGPTNHGLSNCATTHTHTNTRARARAHTPFASRLHFLDRMAGASSVTMTAETQLDNARMPPSHTLHAANQHFAQSQLRRRVQASTIVNRKFMQVRSEFRSHRTRRSETHQEAALGAAPDSDLRPRHTALEEVLYWVELIYRCALQRRAESPGLYSQDVGVH